MAGKRKRNGGLSEEAVKLLENLSLKIPNEESRKRLFALWCIAKMKMKVKDAAKHVGLEPGSVSNLLCRFNNAKDEEAKKKTVISEGRGGRRREKISREEEKQMLAELAKLAGKRGVKWDVIAEHYAEACGIEPEDVNYQTLYTVLRRNHWESRGKRRYGPSGEQNSGDGSR